MTLFDATEKQVRALLDSVQFDSSQTESALSIVRAMAASWGGATVDEYPLWSGIGDDCSPVEYSVVNQLNRPELRVLVESHANPCSPMAYWQAALETTERLRKLVSIDTSKIDSLMDLFVPSGPENEVFFSAFHAVVFWPNHAPMVKLYLNPGAQGFESTEDVMAEALSRLGYAKAWESMRELLVPGRVQPAFLSMDLSAGEGDRVKVYLRHRMIPFDSVERACRTAREYTPGDPSRFFAAMSGSDDDPMQITRAILTTHSFTDSAESRPDRIVVQMPVYPYVEDDAKAASRIRSCLTSHGISTSLYDTCEKLLREEGTSRSDWGLNSWVSFVRANGKPRVATYFSPRLYLDRFGPLSLDPDNAWARERN